MNVLILQILNRTQANRRITFFTALWVVLSLTLSGCSGSFNLAGWLQGSTATPTSPPVSLTPTPQPSLQPTRSPTATPTGPQTLVVWVPPQFDPALSPAGEKLRARLLAFESENPNLKVQVRVKAASGPGGLIESLSTANAAAPAALPSLVALSRSDLENAALKGLIFPIDRLTRLIDDPDWYPYARQLALIQGSAFGIPFAGDALLMLYRTAKGSSPPVDWAAILKAGQPVAFPAADSQSLLTLLLYLSAGGQIKDSQGRPFLQAEPLSKVLRLYADGAKPGVFPNWLAQYQTDGQAWQAYREQRTQLLVTWSSRYLADLPADTSAVPVPGMGSQPITLATGWVWALADPLTERQATAVRLAEFLANSEFLSQWNAAAGYLPTRPSALTGWTNQSLRSLLSPVALAAQIRPANDVLLSLGSTLQDATLQVIKQQGDPLLVAQAAAERLMVKPGN